MNALMFLGGAGLVAYALTRKETAEALPPGSSQALARDERLRNNKLALIGGGGLILGSILL